MVPFERMSSFQFPCFACLESQNSLMSNQEKIHHGVKLAFWVGMMFLKLPSYRTSPNATVQMQDLSSAIDASVGSLVKISMVAWHAWDAMTIIKVIYISSFEHDFIMRKWIWA